MREINILIEIAEKEVGYLEKKTNAYLDDKEANAGDANYTKYGKEMVCNGFAWCDAFVDWCFVKAFGTDRAKELLNGFSNYTPTSAQYFKNIGCWYNTPKIGDVIFFKNDTRICHTGIVYNVEDGKVFTIEGNTSDGAEVIPNGGKVAKKSYLVNNTRIVGYGRPLYKEVEKGMKYGIDVSDNQGLIDWINVKASGVQFAILRSTRGSGKADEYLPTNIKGCVEQCIPFDFYKYSYAMNEYDARTEAKTVVEVLKDYGIIPNGTTRIWLDMEYDKQLALGKEKCFAIMQAFKDEVVKGGFSYGLYMGKYAYENKIDPRLLDDDVWIARYPDTSVRGLRQLPDEKYAPQAKGGSSLWGWQFSSKGKIAGINGNVDLDVCYYDVDEKEVAPQYYNTPEFTLIESLNKIGVDSSFKNRKEIARINNIENYSGKKEENLLMLSLLIDGKLRKN